MDTIKALRVFRELAKAELRRLAIDANLHERCGAQYPAAVKASQKRKEIQAAMAVLEEVLNPEGRE